MLDRQMQKERAAGFLRAVMDEKDAKGNPLYARIFDTQDILKDTMTLISARSEEQVSAELLDSPAGQELFKETLREYINLTAEEKANYNRNLALFLSNAEHAVLDRVDGAPKRDPRNPVDFSRVKYLKTDEGIHAFSKRIVDYLRPDVKEGHKLESSTISAQMTIPYGRVANPVGEEISMG